jgi:beta-phosphoglucomutase-like phosphatase (HAD superfamily)
MTPRLIIFDCDGVLVDSEPISVSVLRDTLATAGEDMTEAKVYARFLGRSLGLVVQVMRDDYGLALTDTHLNDMRARLYDRFGAELCPIAGVGAATRAAGLPICVASSSQPERIRLSPDLTGLLAMFDPHLYGASMVKHGKPAPDLFLHAAAAMGARPEDCVVIEDSPAGMAAARAAGMACLAFTGDGHAVPGKLRAAAEELAPDAIFDDMRALPGLITALADRDGAP